MSIGDSSRTSNIRKRRLARAGRTPDLGQVSTRESSLGGAENRIESLKAGGDRPGSAGLQAEKCFRGRDGG